MMYKIKVNIDPIMCILNAESVEEARREALKSFNDLLDNRIEDQDIRNIIIAHITNKEME